MTNAEMLDHTALDFGKYKGKTPSDIADDDPSYVVWMYEKVKPVRCSRALYKECQLDLATEETDEDDYGGTPDAFSVWDSQDLR